MAPPFEISLAGAAVLGVIASALVEVAIGRLRQLPENGVLVFGADSLHQKLTEALKANPPSPSLTGVISPVILKTLERLDQEKDPFGRYIPSEYFPDFDPADFCWWGFFFPELWSFWKGLVWDGMRYIILSEGIALIAVYVVFHLQSLVLRIVLGVIFFLISVLPGFWCGFFGYMNYSKLVNRSSPLKLTVMTIVGRILFWIILLLSLILNAISLTHIKSYFYHF